jgi:DNA polymerase-3 subunit delta'
MALKPEKEGAAIGIDDVRALIKDAGLKPYEGRKKVYIIDDASNMREDASSALLKTLEEPPSDLILILIADNMERLLSTIVSRSQVVRFFALRIDEVKDVLSAGYGLDQTKANILSHMSSGRLGEALKYNSAEFFIKRDSVIEALEKKIFFESDFDKLSKADLKIYLDILLTWYRDVLIAKSAGAGGAEIVNIDKKEAVFSEAAKAEYDGLDRMIRQIILTYSFLEQNVNPKLAMAALGISA